MRKFIYVIGIWLAIGGLACAATLTRGKTFTATEEVTNSKLHQLVDSATLSDIEQSDLKANYGTAIRSTTQPADTDALWVDTTNNCLKAYVSGAYEEVGVSPVSVTTGTIIGTSLTITGATDITGVTQISNDVTIIGSLSISGTVRLFGQPSGRSITTVYQATTDGIVQYTVDSSSGTDYTNAYTDSANPPTTEVAATYSHIECYVPVTFPVKKGNYYKVTETGAATISKYTFTPIGG